MTAPADPLGALRKYGRHLLDCHHASDEFGELINAYRILGPCDCGFDAALAALSTPPAQEKDEDEKKK